MGGYDFAAVIAAYWRGHNEGDETLKATALRWLRAEFSTKTEARQALGVRTIIDDSNSYDILKLFALLVEQSGFSGFIVAIDEVVNLYKLPSGQARRTNYEKMLGILNDSLQGNARGIGFVFGCTPELLTDPRKGLYSYEALKTRLASNAFARDDLVDFSGPVMQLENLSPEDLFVLLQNIRHIHAFGEEDQHALPDEGLVAFMEHCRDRIGDAYFQTPRNTIVAFVGLLAVLEQNPNAEWRAVLGDVTLAPQSTSKLKLGDNESIKPDDELASFSL